MNWTRYVSMAAIAAVIAVGPAVADMKGGRDGDGKGGPMMKRMAKKLELSQTQQDQVKKLNEGRGPSMKPLREKMRDQMKQLRALVEKKASDGEISPVLAQVKQSHAAIRAAEEKHHEAMAAVLTPTQQAKMALWMGHQARERWGKGKGKGKGRGEWKEHEGRGEGHHDGDDDDDK